MPLEKFIEIRDLIETQVKNYDDSTLARISKCRQWASNSSGYMFHSVRIVSASKI